MTDNSRILVIGVGNRHRSDDGVGLIAADRLEALHLPAVMVKTDISDGVSLIDAWEGYDVVYVIDAVVSDAEPGKIYRFDASSGTIPKAFFNSYSTHVFSVAQAVQLAFALDRLPHELVVFGIEAACFDHGQRISAGVLEAAELVVNRIAEETSAMMEKVR